jgi:hypothetical protein
LDRSPSPKLGDFFYFFSQKVFFIENIFIYLLKPIKLRVMKLDYKKIDNVEVSGIDFQDYPDFVDAYIISADYEGREMTEQELDAINEDSEFVYDQVQKHLF